ncbi:putative ribonuclease H-like domain-containing protein [Tanacetum coccineum]
MYFLVITDDYSRFSWVFFLAKKDETSGILKNFITGIENQLNHKVKVIRCNNGTEFKNNEMNQFCGIKGIKREFSNARTPQQNGVAERKNRTLNEAARTMLADSLLPIPFWAEAVNTACYVQNRVLVTKPHNKTPYELLLGQGEKEKVPDQECILLLMMHTTSYVPSNPEEDISSPSFEAKFNEKLFEGLDRRTNSTNSFNTVSNLLYTASKSRTVYPARPSKAPPLISFDDTLPIDISEYPDDPLMPDLEDTVEPQGTGIFGRAYDDDEFYNSPFDDPNVGAKADFNNMEPFIVVSPIPTTRIHSIHPKA